MFYRKKKENLKYHIRFLILITNHFILIFYKVLFEIFMFTSFLIILMMNFHHVPSSI